MKAAIIGYGKMGKEIEKILLERGHQIALIVDTDNAADLNATNLKGVDVALEFTIPETAYNNIRTCIDNRTPVVSGTTGWTARLEELKRRCREQGSALFYASNYCLGVNLMFRLNKQLARMMNNVSGYEVEIEETHHIHKKDAPSGTAISLAEQIISELQSKTSWVNDMPANPNQIEIHSLREGEIAGIHTITYESENDSLILKHTIKNRRTLAMGAVIAAEFLCKKQGVYSMDDLLNC